MCKRGGLTKCEPAPALLVGCDKENGVTPTVTPTHPKITYMTQYKKFLKVQKWHKSAEKH
jgi:hypothetical protein